MQLVNPLARAIVPQQTESIFDELLRRCGKLTFSLNDGVTGGQHNRLLRGLYIRLAESPPRLLEVELGLIGQELRSPLHLAIKAICQERMRTDREIFPRDIGERRIPLKVPQAQD